MKTKEEIQKEVDELISGADNLIKEAASTLKMGGIEFDLTEWVTIKEYCRRFNVKNTETVSNWVKRGIIPAEDTAIVEEFNNIRLIRAKPYQVKAGQAV